MNPAGQIHNHTGKAWEIRRKQVYNDKTDFVQMKMKMNVNVNVNVIEVLN